MESIIILILIMEFLQLNPLIVFIASSHSFVIPPCFHSLFTFSSLLLLICMSSSFSSRVFTLYRSLHRQRLLTFTEDSFALRESKVELRNHFKSNSSLNDPKRIEQAVKDGEDALEFLRTFVIQAKKRLSDGVFGIIH